MLDHLLSFVMACSVKVHNHCRNSIITVITAFNSGPGTVKGGGYITVGACSSEVAIATFFSVIKAITGNGVKIQSKSLDNGECTFCQGRQNSHRVDVLDLHWQLLKLFFGCLELAADNHAL